MEIGKKKVVKSEFYYVDIQDVYEYGEATFGVKLADSFFEIILNEVESLETQYLLHPECRHLETKTKIYRNIILGSYLIIYRITVDKIQILRAFHGSRSPQEMKKVKKIRP